jgi:arylamine N-acetyltransferase
MTPSPSIPQSELHLESALVPAVLRHLGVAAAPPSPGALDELMAAYTQRVPWESASRIVRRAQIASAADSPRWPSIFWRQALAQGTGGTCFESNYAFFALLRHLGYDGYLTINDMGATIGCHTAIIIRLQGARYLVDAGFPVHLPLLLPQAAETTIRETPFHTYSLIPHGPGRCQVERDRHPQPNCFTLIDTPVDLADYQAATRADYGPEGLFLDRVIVSRVVDGREWRFAADGPPYHLESFADGDKTYHLLGTDPAAAAEQVARKFEMSPDLLRAALQLVSA